MKVFLDYADEGSKFVFGNETYMHHEMAFKVSSDSSPIQYSTDVQMAKTYDWCCYYANVL